MWAIPSQEYEKAEMSILFSKIQAIKIYSLVISSNR